MRVDFSSHQSGKHRPAAAAASLVAGVVVVIFASLAPQDDHWGDVSAETPWYSPRAASASGSSTALQEMPALLEPALRSLDGVAYHG